MGKGAAYPLHKITFAVIACLHTTHKPLHPCAPSPLHMIPRIAAWPAPRGPILHSHISSLAFHNSHAATNIGPRGDAFSPLCASLIFKCTGQPCRGIFCGPGGDTVVGPLGAPWHRMCHHGTMVERERPSAAQGSGPMRSCMCTQVQCCTRPALGFRTQVHGCAPPALPSQTQFPGCAPTALPFRAGIQCGAHPALLTEPDSAEQNPHIHGQPGLDSRISDLRGLAGTHYVPRQRARQQ